MNKELLHKTIKLIEDSGFSNWNSIIELSNNKEKIKQIWYSKVESDLIKYFTSNLSENWDLKNCNTWYLKNSNESSFGLWFENFHIFSIWASPDLYDINKAKEILQKKEFSIIADTFERIDKRFDAGYKYREIGNFKFDSDIDGYFDSDTIAFFAGTQTESFCKQIISKIEKFTNNKEITDLFDQLNKQTKKK